MHSIYKHCDLGPCAHRPQVELGFSHDVQTGCESVKELLVAAVEEDELPLLCRLLRPCTQELRAAIYFNSSDVPAFWPVAGLRGLRAAWGCNDELA